MQWSDTIETNLVEGYRAASSWIMGMSFFDSGTLQDRLVQEAATPSEAARQEGERVARLAHVTRKFASSFERIHQLVRTDLVS